MPVKGVGADRKNRGPNLRVAGRGNKDEKICKAQLGGEVDGKALGFRPMGGKTEGMGVLSR